MKIATLGPRLASPDLRRVSPAPKVAAPIYGTPEHRAWRTEVIRRAGGRCQVCGVGGVRLFADHVVELRDGGAPFDPANGQALCGSHHTKKTAEIRRFRAASPDPEG